MTTTKLHSILNEVLRLSEDEQHRCSDSAIKLLVSKWWLYDEDARTILSVEALAMDRILRFFPFGHANFPAWKYYIQSSELGLPVSTLQQVRNGKIVQTAKISRNLLWASVHLMARILSLLTRRRLRPCNLKVTNIMVRFRPHRPLDHTFIGEVIEFLNFLHTNDHPLRNTLFASDARDEVLWPIEHWRGDFPAYRILRKLRGAPDSDRKCINQLFNIYGTVICTSGHTSTEDALRARKFILDVIDFAHTHRQRLMLFTSQVQPSRISNVILSSSSSSSSSSSHNLADFIMSE